MDAVGHWLMTLPIKPEKTSEHITSLITSKRSSNLIQPTHHTNFNRVNHMDIRATHIEQDETFYHGEAQ